METNQYLLLGESEHKRRVYMNKQARLSNTLVVGCKNTGKSTKLIPYFANQDLKNKDVGATYIVSDKDVAYYLYAMCKEEDRKVVLISPSVNLECENLLNQEEYDYDYISLNIINYEEIIKKKYIVIIDMEYSIYKNLAIKSVSMLLTQFYIAMQQTDITNKESHYLYIDNAKYYIPYVEDILKDGDFYNVGTTLFIQSRNDLIIGGNDYKEFIEANTKNILLMNYINTNDYIYYKNLFYEMTENKFLNRNFGEIIYQNFDFKNRKTGIVTLENLDKDYHEIVLDRACKLKKKLYRKTKKIKIVQKKAEILIKKKLEEIENKTGLEEIKINELKKEIEENVKKDLKVPKKKEIKQSKTKMLNEKHKDILKNEFKKKASIMDMYKDKEICQIDFDESEDFF